MKRVVAFLRFDEAEGVDLAMLRKRARHFGADTSTLLRVVRPPEGLPYRPPNRRAPEESWHDYDAVLLLDGTDRPMDWRQFEVKLTAVHAYTVEARQIFERGDPTREPDAIVLLGQLMFHVDLPDSAARRSWSLHATLAERVHVGATAYTQNWVVAPLSADCPPARGMPQMRWPNQRALVERFFDSERGREEIFHDTAHFISSGSRFYLRAN